MTQRMNNRFCATALAYAHVRELRGAKHNPVIVDMLRNLLPWARTDETPWCSAFVYRVTIESGWQPSEKVTAAARSWLKAGAPTTQEGVIPGDIVILSRGNPTGWQGHVGFYCRHNSRYIWLLGGNQGNAVSIKAYRRSRVLGIRRL